MNSYRDGRIEQTHKKNKDHSLMNGMVPRFITAFLVMLLCLNVVAGPVAAQTAAEALADQADDTPEPIDTEIAPAGGVPDSLTAAQELAEQAEVAAAEEAAQIVAPAPARTVRHTPPQRMTVRSVTVGASAYLSDEQVSVVVASLIGRQIDLRDAGQLAAAFNAAYAAQGVGLASAVVAAVDPRSGHVQIVFDEPRIGRVRVADGALASGAHYAMRLALPEGELADTRMIATRQLRLQRLSGVRTELTSAPGAEPGTVDLTLTPIEPPARVFSVALDNHGNRTTGRERVNLSFSETSLTGRLDPLSLSVTLARGVRSGSVGYALPIGSEGVSIFSSGSLERTRSVQGLDLRSRTQSAELGVSLPLVVSAESQLVLRASVQHFREERRTLGVVTTDQRGTVLALGANYARFFDRTAIGYDQSLRHVLWNDALIGRSRTTVLGGEGSGSLALGEAWQGIARLGWQAVLGQNMPAFFRASLSSPTRVRGYDPSVSSGDAFIFGSAQVQRATPWTLREGEDAGLSVFPFAFVDIGRAFDRAGGVLASQDMLTSVGLGSVVQIGSRGIGEIVLAMPLRDANGFNAAGRVRADLRLGVRF